MKLPPQKMTVYQLKAAIEVYKRHIEHCNNGGVDLTTAAGRSTLSRYRSALKVAEFTLQGKQDIVDSCTRLNEANRKAYTKAWTEALKKPFDRLNFDLLVSDTRAFIQNVNEDLRPVLKATKKPK